MAREVWVNKEDDNHPIFWDKEVNGVLYGKRNKVHTVQIAVKVPNLRMDMKLTAINPDGKKQIIEGESHSWTRNYYNWLCCAMGKNASDPTTFGDGLINAKNNAGVVRSSTTRAFLNYALIDKEHAVGGYDGYSALVGNSLYGITPGNADHTDHPESFNGYEMPHPIVHGVGAGNLYYQTSPYPALKTWNSGTRTWSERLPRFFDNFSGGAITVKDIGQVGLIILAVTGTNYHLVARDLIDDFAIADRTAAMISYIYSLVFPSTGSPLRNFYNYLFVQFASVNGSDNTTFGDGYLNWKDTSGNIDAECDSYGAGFETNQDLDVNYSNCYGFSSIAADTGGGGRVGTGNTAVSFDDFELASIIVNGTGAGQMSYQPTITPVVRSWSDPVMTIQHSRFVLNESGGSITVKEVGLIGGLYVGVTKGRYLVLRDVISDVVVADAESIRTVHQLQVTYPVDRS